MYTVIKGSALGKTGVFLNVITFSTKKELLRTLAQFVGYVPPASTLSAAYTNSISWLMGET